jgi:cation diffusion facilitator CzcD-associated flavoprotein CzcO
MLAENQGGPVMTDRSDPDAAARETLRLIGPDPRNWVPDRPGIDHNVVLVGGGQTGCALAFALRRAGIGSVTVIDAAPDADAAGMWLHTGRMHLLRTPKSLVGPEGSLPALGFQAWYEVRHGAAAYQALDRIPRIDWAAYLAWYRTFLGIPVRYGVRLRGIEPAEGGLRLHLDDNGAARTEATRKVVLCTGFDGIGRPAIPPEVAALPAALRAHTEQRIDFAALAGKRVAVIGAAASAFDAAGVALEQGAAAVHLFARRPEIAATPISRSRGYPGAYDNYAALPDAIRWQQALRFRRAGSTPTIDAVERAVRHANFRLHLAAPWRSAAVQDGVIRATTADGTHLFDFVIAGTGYTPDLGARPELAALAPLVALWRDRFTPCAEEADGELGAYPYLGEGHEYLEKVPHSAPWLGDIHVQNPSGFVSFGVPTGDVPSMKRDVPAIAGRISRDLFLADLPAHAARMLGPVPPDFGPALYQAAIASGRQ